MKTTDQDVAFLGQCGAGPQKGSGPAVRRLLKAGLISQVEWNPNHWELTPKGRETLDAMKKFIHLSSVG